MVEHNGCVVVPPDLGDDLRYAVMHALFYITFPDRPIDAGKVLALAREGRVYLYSLDVGEARWLFDAVYTTANRRPCRVIPSIPQLCGAGSGGVAASADAAEVRVMFTFNPQVLRDGRKCGGRSWEAYCSAYPADMAREVVAWPGEGATGSLQDAVRRVVAADGVLLTDEEHLDEVLDAMGYVVTQTADPYAPGDRCGDAKSILAAIKQDSLVSVVAGQNPDDLLRAIEQRLRQNEMPVPECIVCLTMWGTLLVQYHWRFADLFGLNPHSSGGYNLPVRMAGKPKASLAEVMPEFLEDYAPAQPFGLFRILFGCRLLGISWREDAIERSRLFLLKDGERILPGVIPRGSAFNPFALQGDGGGTYGLFDVSACGDEGGMPMFRSVSRTCVDAALGDGAVMLFAVAARRRDDGELLAALFSDENAKRGILRLISDTQFFLCPDAVHGTLEFSANLLVSVNHHLRTLHAPQYTVDEAVFHQARPACRIVSVDASVSGDREALDEIAYQLTGHDVAISLPEGTDFETGEAIRRRLGYIVLPGTPYLEPGGALCGFQFPDRVLVKGAVDQFSSGNVWYETRERQAANQTQHAAAVARREEETRRRREAHKRLMAEQRRQAEERRATKERAAQQREEEARRKTEAAFAALKVGSAHFAYHYTRKGTGERQDGDLFADSLDEAYAKLMAVGIRPGKVYPFGERRSAAPAPDPVAGRLELLKALYDMGVVSDAEYAEQRKRILAEL